jgi:hypothetical protein
LAGRAPLLSSPVRSGPGVRAGGRRCPAKKEDADAEEEEE